MQVAVGAGSRCSTGPALPHPRSTASRVLGVGCFLAPHTSRWHRIPARDTVLGATEANGASDADAKPKQQTAAEDVGTGVSTSSSGPVATPKSHPLALPEDPFAAEELVEELKDTSSLGKRGELYLAAQVLAVVFVLFPPFKLAGLFDLMATLALTAGLVFCVYGLISLGRYFSPLPTPRKKHKLVTDGLFAYVRHPIYGGLVLAALGLAAITRSEGRLALAILLWAVSEHKAAYEESCLVQRYGAEYKAYIDKTKKFVPLLY